MNCSPTPFTIGYCLVSIIASDPSSAAYEELNLLKCPVPAKMETGHLNYGRSTGYSMKIYLVDGTYELFRSHFGAPPRKAPDGREVGATLGLLPAC